MTAFNNRVYGCVLVKSINSNYNADFSHQPRSLPNGVVYATDKALKYAIRNYLKDVFPNEKIFYFKSLKEDTGNPRSLDERFEQLFPNHKENKEKPVVSNDLLSCLDIRLFGATYANKIKKVAVSIHGPVQFNHGINIWKENNIFSEQIQSPFSDPDAPKAGEEVDEKAQTTLGRQAKLQEGHYLHHFSINPKNLQSIVKAAGQGAQSLSTDDIVKLKAALQMGVTYYDSASKAGTDNELLLWVELKEDSTRVLPNFTRLIKVEKDNGKLGIDFKDLSAVLKENADQIESVMICYLKEEMLLKNLPELPGKLKLCDLNSGKEITQITQS